LSNPRPCIVLIGAPEVLPGLKKSIDPNAELLTFADVDALRALEVISRRRPDAVIAEKTFAATPRGAALINRIKADPTLIKSEIRVVGPKPTDLRIVSAGESSVAVSEPAAAAPAPLDQRGTRRAPRYKIAGLVEIVADGNVATVVDLSTIGAQIVSASILKPNQKVRMILTDDKATIRFGAIVAWASFEIPPKDGPRYRAGIEFIDADAEALQAFCIRHKQ
jgi:PilZ domain-containing protein